MPGHKNHAANAAAWAISHPSIRRCGLQSVDVPVSAGSELSSLDARRRELEANRKSIDPPLPIPYIPYPYKQSEVEIQASVWVQLCAAGADARMEVTGRSGQCNCLFDIVVFRDKLATCIIECKSWGPSADKTVAATWQLLKYRRFGIPVLVCGNMENVAAVVKDALTY